MLRLTSIGGKLSSHGRLRTIASPPCRIFPSRTTYNYHEQPPTSQCQRHNVSTRRFSHTNTTTHRSLAPFRCRSPATRPPSSSTSSCRYHSSASAPAASPASPVYIQKTSREWRSRQFPHCLRRLPRPCRDSSIRLFSHAPTTTTTNITSTHDATAEGTDDWSKSHRDPHEDFAEDTIYALSTAHGRAGIAIIRISGPACLDVYRGLCPQKALPKPRFATVRTLIDQHAARQQDVHSQSQSQSHNDNGGVLDTDALVLYFPGPRTVTGEDVLELHVHGGLATVKAVLSAIPTSVRAPSPSPSPRSPSAGFDPGLSESDPLSLTSSVVRYAEPGEFTRRAFLNDRLDLAQVESLSDTLAAETEQQRRAAVRGSSGALGRTYDAWREQLLLARGEIEALIDFSEDQHFDESPADLLDNVSVLVDDMLRSIQAHERAGQRAELLRGGIRIALVGPPNAGKSSLMNLIVGREASIVSVEAGTTRDVVEASLDIRGYLCSFADTAGFRGQRSVESGSGSADQIGLVEGEGIRRARQKALESDIVVALAAVERNAQGDLRINYDEETLALAARAQSSMIIVNKRDAAAGEDQMENLLSKFRADIASVGPGLAKAELALISCKEAQDETQKTSAREHRGRLTASVTDSGGVHALIESLSASFAAMTSLPVDMQDLLGVTARQRQLLEKCRGWLEEYSTVAQSSTTGEEPDIVLAAEYLRYAADCLAKITGRGEAGDTEEVLGVIFEK